MQMNRELYEVVTPEGIKSVCRSDLRVGDFVHIHPNQTVPADCVLLHVRAKRNSPLSSSWPCSRAIDQPSLSPSSQTTEKSGASFIRTDQLDGETDWKLRCVGSCLFFPLPLCRGENNCVRGKRKNKAHNSHSHAVRITQRSEDLSTLRDLDVSVYGTCFVLGFHFSLGMRAPVCFTAPCLLPPQWRHPARTSMISSVASPSTPMWRLGNLSLVSPPFQPHTIHRPHFSQG